MDVLKDLGLASPVRLMVRAGTKGKEIKKRGKPEPGDLVNESVPPAVAMGGACVLDLPPQPDSSASALTRPNQCYNSLQSGGSPLWFLSSFHVFFPLVLLWFFSSSLLLPSSYSLTSLLC